MLVTATDLELWSNRRDAQEELPRLIRRLVNATLPHATVVDFPAGEGVQRGGWDGVVDVAQGNAFAPDGLSGWELGCGSDIKRKADGDYQKRTERPLGIRPADSTFVFVTPRRWGEKREWQAARKDEGIWRDVRVIDADILETWLEGATSVHVWISGILGKYPDGVIDAENYWLGWANSTAPALPPAFVLAGRQEILGKIRAWVEDPIRPLALRSETREEATAVFCAALQSLGESDRTDALARTMIVRDPSAWNKLAVTGEPLFLVQEFENSQALGLALQRGHAVVVPLGLPDADSPATVAIPRISTEDAASALVDTGVSEEEAGKLAALARRSLTTLRRRIAHVPCLEQPLWSTPELGRGLVPALLLGRWSDQVKGDRQAISRIANRPFDEVMQALTRWVHEEDPPIRCVGSAWYLSSPEDIWTLLGKYITQHDLATFVELATRVLCSVDPAVHRSPEQQLAAALRGERPSYSGLIRAGLANTLAFMGSRGGAIQTTGGLSLQDVASRCVHEILASDDWKLWSSLPLPLLAEAAPSEFLAACERGMRGDQPFLPDLFVEDGDPIFGSSPYVTLLFALETTAWCPEYLSRTALVLAQLATVDPGGRLSNRPQASIDAIFLPWCPQTTAPLDERLRTLDLLRERYPVIAWKSMIRALPKLHDSAGPTAKPHWREWAPEHERHPTPIERAKANQEFIVRVLEDAGLDGSRWANVLGALPCFPLQEYNEAVAQLARLDQAQLAPVDLDLEPIRITL